MKIANETYPEPNNSLETLYVLADNILALKHQESIRKYMFGEDSPYENIVFRTVFCGEPRRFTSLNLPVVVSQVFPNPIGGLVMYGCNYVIHCRELPNILDLDGRQIYEGSNGSLFVYRYTPSMPGHMYDDALFAPPRIEFAESKDMHYVYSKASELVVNQMLGGLLQDELLKLALTNRITELQTQAYMQGRGYKESMHYDTSLPSVTTEEDIPDLEK